MRFIISQINGRTFAIDDKAELWRYLSNEANIGDKIIISNTETNELNNRTKILEKENNEDEING